MSRPRVVVIGAGFGGIGLAARLKQAGYTGDELVVLEKADGIGGTWRDNTYPGAACDIPSHLYSFSFAPNDWSHRFSPQSEILAYLHRVAREFGVLPHLRFGSEVCRLVFDEEQGHWQIELADGTSLDADVVVSAVGQLNRPNVPALPGLREFAGPWWHSARWRHDVDLTGKRVAVVGTGASAVQFVPEVAKTAAEVSVFQRSAPYLHKRPDKAYAPSYRALLRTAPPLQRLARLGQYLTYESRAFAFVTAPSLMSVFHRRWESWLEEEVADPELRAQLTPDYVIGCKRILISNDWYATLRRPNVHLVTERIQRIVADGIVTSDGVEHPADALVFGTGFRTLEFLQPMRVVGRGGRSLDELWRDAAEGYLGTMVAGFPNFFTLYGPNTNLGHNSIIYMLESQIAFVLDALATLQREGLAWLDVRADVQRAWNAELREKSASTVFESGCHSWYTNAAGRNVNNWPSYTFAFRRRTRRVNLADFEVGRRRSSLAPPTPVRQ